VTHADPSSPTAHTRAANCWSGATRTRADHAQHVACDGEDGERRAAQRDGRRDRGAKALGDVRARGAALHGEPLLVDLTRLLARGGAGGRRPRLRRHRAGGEEEGAVEEGAEGVAQRLPRGGGRGQPEREAARGDGRGRLGGGERPGAGDGCEGVARPQAEQHLRCECHVRQQRGGDEQGHVQAVQQADGVLRRRRQARAGGHLPVLELEAGAAADRVGDRGQQGERGDHAGYVEEGGPEEAAQHGLSDGGAHKQVHACRRGGEKGGGETRRGARDVLRHALAPEAQHRLQDATAVYACCDVKVPQHCAVCGSGALPAAALRAAQDPPLSLSDCVPSAAVRPPAAAPLTHAHAVALGDEIVQRDDGERARHQLRQHEDGRHDAEAAVHSGGHARERLRSRDGDGERLGRGVEEAAVLRGLQVHGQQLGAGSELHHDAGGEDGQHAQLREGAGSGGHQRTDGAERVAADGAGASAASWHA